MRRDKHGLRVQSLTMGAFVVHLSCSTDHLPRDSLRMCHSPCVTSDLQCQIKSAQPGSSPCHAAAAHMHNQKLINEVRHALHAKCCFKAELQGCLWVHRVPCWCVVAYRFALVSGMYNEQNKIWMKKNPLTPGGFAKKVACPVSCSSSTSLFQIPQSSN